jgi:hypothetical protein
MFAVGEKKECKDGLGLVLSNNQCRAQRNEEELQINSNVDDETRGKGRLSEEEEYGYLCIGLDAKEI